MPTKFFYHPTQVKFYDGGEWIGGIAYQDLIICGCCGSIFRIDDIYEVCEGTMFNPVVIHPWLNISNEILGE